MRWYGADLFVACAQGSKCVLKHTHTHTHTPPQDAASLAAPLPLPPASAVGSLLSVKREAKAEASAPTSNYSPAYASAAYAQLTSAALGPTNNNPAAPQISAEYQPLAVAAATATATASQPQRLFARAQELSQRSSGVHGLSAAGVDDGYSGMEHDVAAVMDDHDDHHDDADPELSGPSPAERRAAAAAAPPASAPAAEPAAAAARPAPAPPRVRTLANKRPGDLLRQTLGRPLSQPQTLSQQPSLSQEQPGMSLPSQPSQGSLLFADSAGDATQADGAVAELLQDLNTAVLGGAPRAREAVASDMAAAQARLRQERARAAVRVHVTAKERERTAKEHVQQNIGAPNVNDKRIEAEANRLKRKDAARQLMGRLMESVQTPTAFALAVPSTPRHPRLVAPKPSLSRLTEYRPTQLELEWNKALLGGVDWIGVQDIDLVNPSVYGTNELTRPPHVAEADKEIVRTDLPYDKEDEREAWKGKGRVPVFAVRPAYTEVGLRSRRATRDAATEELEKIRDVRENRETEEEKVSRFRTDIRSTFQQAEAVDQQWVMVLLRVGHALGLPNPTPDAFADPAFVERFRLLRQQTLSMAARATEEGLRGFDATIRSVAPELEDAEAIACFMQAPELHKSALAACETEEEKEACREEWREAWVKWGVLYASEMRSHGLTEETRNDALAKRKKKHQVGDVLRTVHAARDKANQSELLHPSDPNANLVSVKEVKADEAEITQERDLLVVTFETSDPIPVDKLSPDSDFFDLTNKEQLRKRNTAPDTLYDGSIVLRKVNLAGKITAEYLMPTDTNRVEEAAAALRDESVIDASWNTPKTADGQNLCVEYDTVDVYEGKLVHQRESTFVFRETPGSVLVSYPPRRLALSSAAEQVEQEEEGRRVRLNAPVESKARARTKHIFTWDSDLARWAQEDAEAGRTQEFAQAMQALRRKRRAADAAEMREREQAKRRRRDVYAGEADEPEPTTSSRMEVDQAPAAAPVAVPAGVTGIAAAALQMGLGGADGGGGDGGERGEEGGAEEGMLEEDCPNRRNVLPHTHTHPHKHTQSSTRCNEPSPHCKPPRRD